MSELLSFLGTSAKDAYAYAEECEKALTKAKANQLTVFLDIGVDLDGKRSQLEGLFENSEAVTEVKSVRGQVTRVQRSILDLMNLCGEARTKIKTAEAKYRGKNYFSRKVDKEYAVDINACVNGLEVRQRLVSKQYDQLIKLLEMYDPGDSPCNVLKHPALRLLWKSNKFGQDVNVDLFVKSCLAKERIMTKAAQRKLTAFLDKHLPDNEEQKQHLKTTNHKLLAIQELAVFTRNTPQYDDTKSFTLSLVDIVEWLVDPNNAPMADLSDEVREQVRVRRNSVKTIRARNNLNFTKIHDAIADDGIADITEKVDALDLKVQDVSDSTFVWLTSKTGRGNYHLVEGHYKSYVRVSKKKARDMGRQPCKSGKCKNSLNL